MYELLYFRECIMNFMLACTRMNISSIAGVTAELFYCSFHPRKKSCSKIICLLADLFERGLAVVVGLFSLSLFMHDNSSIAARSFNSA